MNYMESGHGAKSNSCLDDYIISYESGLKLFNSTKKEIKTVLKTYILKGNGIGNLTQKELVKMFDSMNDWNVFFWYGVGIQLMENGLLDPIYLDFLARFIIFENNFCTSNEAREIKNNPKLLDKYTKTVRMKIYQILYIEKNNNI